MSLPFAKPLVPLVLSFAVLTGAGNASGTSLPSATTAVVGGVTRIPYGWVDFCGRQPRDCNVERLAPRDLQLSLPTWNKLNLINRNVNHLIQPVSNFDHWGTTLDHWDYPVDGKGDCKIYALYKRKLLMENGFPRQALLMTIVRDLDGDGHAVLTVKTDHGDFVLDNLTDEIRPWDATGYRYLKRQAQDDPNVWVDLGDVRGPGARMASAKIQD